MSSHVTDVRCPAGPRNLFARYNKDSGLWEIACPACRRTLAAIGGNPKYVLHRYTGEGEYVDTLTILNDEAVDIS